MKYRLALLGAACYGLALAQPSARPPDGLQYAVIVTRHGVRAPTWTAERLNQYSASPWPDFGVPPAYLTAHGRVLMGIMGKFYREHFSAAGLLGKPDCGDSGRVYFWADTDQRTLETARALAEGMLPGCKAVVHSVAEGKNDPLFDPAQSGLARMDPDLGLAAVAGRTGPQLDALIAANRPAFDQLGHVLTGGGKTAKSIFDEPASLTKGAAGVSMSGPLGLASTLTENLLLEYTNGMSGDSLGWGRLNARNLQEIMTLHTSYADLMRRTPYLAGVRGSNLLSHVVRSLEQAVAGKVVKGSIGSPQTTLLVISGHDTNLSNLSGMMNLSWLLPSYQKDDIPPGGALIFSLWRSAGGRYSVRLQFVAQTLDQMHQGTPLSRSNPPPMANVFVPGCGTAAEGYGCDWAAFQRIATQVVDTRFVERE